MPLLRSEPMMQGTVVMPWSGARECIDEIGKKVNVQFEDMNAREMRRPYRKHVQRIEEMERIIRALSAELPTFTDLPDVNKNKIDEFLENDFQYNLDDVEKQLKEINASYVHWKGSKERIDGDRMAATEELQVVSKAEELNAAPRQSEGIGEPLLDAEVERRIGCIAGVVSQADEPRLRMAVFRASRNNAYISTFPIPETADTKAALGVDKSVFVIFFQGAGGSSAPLYQKVYKLCQALGVSLYNWPADSRAAKIRKTYLEEDLRDKQQLLDASTKEMGKRLQEIVDPLALGENRNSKIEDWRMFCVKEKSIYSVLNLCTGDNQAHLRVNVWYPKGQKDEIKRIIKQKQGNLVKMKHFTNVPPTYTRVNDLTEGWQDVINTYGIPRYQEANPALISVVTFPFIFGMMYGDIGHGTMLLGVGAYLCMNAAKNKYTMPMLYYARYMILSLGLFATFAGFMYNDFFSVSLRLFPTRYKHTDTGEWLPQWDIENANKPSALGDGAGPYPFGLDWAWNGAGNELLFVNSMKMKLSVLFGVLQMTVGVFLRWSNALYEKNTLDFVCECFPMLIFMVCFFGWMDYMVLYKWVHTDAPNGPPSIINSLICMAMGQPDLFPVYPGSVELSQKLMLLTMLSVPIMLLPKPFMLKKQHEEEQDKKKKLEQFGEVDTLVDAEKGAGHGDGHGHGEEFEFGEVFIHQVIETIEYVLGTVSHTASYLRIWALSLAHQQLSLVFFDKTLAMGLNMANGSDIGSRIMLGIILYCMFCAWLSVTLAVLLGMDVLECFLHTLRLHWVEFQSKFYKADGYLFDPFSIKKVVSPTGDD